MLLVGDLIAGNEGTELALPPFSSEDLFVRRTNTTVLALAFDGVIGGSCTGAGAKIVGSAIALISSTAHQFALEF